MFELEIDVPGIDPQPHLYESVREALLGIMAKVKCPENVIAKIVVAGDENFAAKVEHYSGEAATDHSHAMAVGKAIPGKSPKRVPGTIVLHVEAVGCACSVMLNAEAAPGNYELHMTYVVAHEMGHCVDVSQRSTALTGTLPLTGDDGKFRIRQLAKRYTEIVVDEFYACVFAAPALHQQTFDDDERRAQKMIVDIHDEIKTAIARGESNHVITLLAGQLFWVILVEYAKLIGHFTGNAAITKCIAVWSGAPPDIADHLLRLMTVLQQSRSKYPQIPPELECELLLIWTAIAKSHGFSFQENSAEDSVTYSLT